MNIVYAVKIFAALMVCAGVMRVFAGPGLRLVMSGKDWRLGWIAITGVLFISCFSVKPALFFVTLPLWALMLANLYGKLGEGRLPAYIMLACICPPITVQLGNIGPLKDILHLTPFRMLGIVLLIPEVIRLNAQRDPPKRPGWLRLCDVATAVYFFYWMVHLYSGFPVSTIGREGIGLALDTVLPYYVLSRACAGADVRRRLLSIALMGATYEAFVGMAESVGRHYLYAQLQWLYGVTWNQAVGLLRGSWLRAEAAFSGPLAFAVLMMFGIGVWHALRPEVRSRSYIVLGLSLIGALLASYSRGPTLAALLMFASYVLLRWLTPKRFLLLSALATVALAIAWQNGLGDWVVEFFKHPEGEDPAADFNVKYRQELLTASLALLRQSPWTGVPNFIQYLEDFRQGEGIIDLVNTYLIVSLNVGILGLVVFLTPYLVSLWRSASGSEALAPALRRETLAWIGLTLALMAAIFTVSPVSIIQPVMIWTVAISLGRAQEGLPARSRARPGLDLAGLKPMAPGPST